MSTCKAGQGHIYISDKVTLGQHWHIRIWLEHNTRLSEFLRNFARVFV